MNTSSCNHQYWQSHYRGFFKAKNFCSGFKPTTMARITGCIPARTATLLFINCMFKPNWTCFPGFTLQQQLTILSCLWVDYCLCCWVYDCIWLYPFTTIEFFLNIGSLGYAEIYFLVMFMIIGPVQKKKQSHACWVYREISYVQSDIHHVFIKCFFWLLKITSVYSFPT